MKEEMGVDKRGGVCFHHEPYLDIFFKNSAEGEGFEGYLTLDSLFE